jgi:hypothetical protein
MQDRAVANDIHINRSQFYPIFNSNILHILDQYSKNVSLKNKSMYEGNRIVDGLSTLKNINYQFNGDTNMLDVNSFDSLYNPDDNTLVSNMTKVANVTKHPFKTLKFF